MSLSKLMRTLNVLMVRAASGIAIVSPTVLNPAGSDQERPLGLRLVLRSCGAHSHDVQVNLSEAHGTMLVLRCLVQPVGPSGR